MQAVVITSEDGKELKGVAPAELAPKIARLWPEATVDLDSKPARLMLGSNLYLALPGQTGQESFLVWLKPAFSLDPVTGLPGRDAFLQEMARQFSAWQRDRIPRALIFGDLDGFKPVNDQYGHQVGDRALGIVARRLNHVTRQEDQVFRWGGDEFAIIAQFPGVSAEQAQQSAQSLMTKIRRAIGVRFKIQKDVFVSVGISLGCALFEEQVGVSELIDTADSRMYADKHDRKNAQT